MELVSGKGFWICVFGSGMDGWGVRGEGGMVWGDRNGGREGG